MIICYGEILLDQFESTNKKTQYVGGAPFNVFYQIHKMGVPSLFVGNISDDKEGKVIQKFFKDNKLDTKGLSIIKDKKTTTAKVTLSNGERTFSLNRNNVADNCFSDDTLDFISLGNIIHVGSFLLETNESRLFLDKIIDYSKKQNKTLSFDLNYREDLFSSKEEALSIYEKYYPQFDIVKMSLDELKLITEKEDIEEALSKLKMGLEVYLITLGKEGSIAYYKNKIVKVESIKQHVVDTTGAGDAFMGAFLANIDTIGLNETLFIPSLLKSTLKFSNIAGALTTRKYGAIPSIPSYKEINEVLEKNTKF